MANAVVTVKLMPTGPDVELSNVEESVREVVDSFRGETGEIRFKVEPVAFGLKALLVTFLMDEDLGSTEKLENALADVDGVQSVDITDVRRALG